MSPGDNNGWHEWSKHVLKELERLNDELKSFEILTRKTTIELATLKAQSALWGAISGIVVTIVVSLLLK